MGGPSVLSHFILLSGTTSILRTFWVGPFEKITPYLYILICSQDHRAESRSGALAKGDKSEWSVGADSRRIKYRNLQHCQQCLSIEGWSQLLANKPSKSPEMTTVLLSFVWGVLKLDWNSINDQTFLHDILVKLLEYIRDILCWSFADLP